MSECLICPHNGCLPSQTQSHVLGQMVSCCSSPVEKLGWRGRSPVPPLSALLQPFLPSPDEPCQGRGHMA